VSGLRVPSVRQLTQSRCCSGDRQAYDWVAKITFLTFFFLSLLIFFTRWTGLKKRRHSGKSKVTHSIMPLKKWSKRKGPLQKRSNTEWQMKGVFYPIPSPPLGNPQKYWILARDPSYSMELIRWVWGTQKSRFFTKPDRKIAKFWAGRASTVFYAGYEARKGCLLYM
jgi:hypothetical protein